MLLRIDVFFGQQKVIVIIQPYTQFHHNLHRRMPSFQYRTGPFTDPDRIPGSKTTSAEHLFSFGEQLIIRNQSGTNINDIDSFDHLFRTRNRTEVFTPGDHRTDDAIMFFIRDCLQQHMRSQNRNSQTPNPVGLNRKSPFPGHRLQNSLDMRSGLHQLIRGQVTDITGTDRQDVFTQ